jgi:hypothetical protein
VGGFVLGSGGLVVLAIFIVAALACFMQCGRYFLSGSA